MFYAFCHLRVPLRLIPHGCEENGEQFDQVLAGKCSTFVILCRDCFRQDRNVRLAKRRETASESTLGNILSRPHSHGPQRHINDFPASGSHSRIRFVPPSHHNSFMFKDITSIQLITALSQLDKHQTFQSTLMDVGRAAIFITCPPRYRRIRGKKSKRRT